MPKRSAEEKIECYRRKIQKLTEIKDKDSRRRRRVRIFSSDSSENEGGETAEISTRVEVHSPPPCEIDSSMMNPTAAAGASPEVQSPCDNTDIRADMSISVPENQSAAAATEPNEANQSTDVELDPEIMEALGESTDTSPEYGPKIHENLAKLWLPLLSKGMTRESKEKSLKQYPIPDNCRLLQAPKLNAEIYSAVPDVVRNRDKALSIHQQQLGCGITAVNRALDLLLRGDNKKEAIQHLSNGCRILSDLHASSTQSRIKLLTPSLDKSYHHVIQEAERDETLFGNKLSEKIKAAKAIERQGLQIKKVNNTKTPNLSQSSGNRSYSTGNWTAPPRRGRGGPKRGSSNRRPYPYQSPAPPPPRTPAQPAATASKPRAPTTL